eukprot:TRINITY_DN19079_c0_g1_i1.p2 TRINITY_DN19079_c0_g1~~TRINITY_DN19079_c0_g1_i1.p2  ORF type:complete len:117 (-),score=27.92 TRINITY_DN19079_c0_g1_i1:429-779(-)
MAQLGTALREVLAGTSLQHCQVQRWLPCSSRVKLDVRYFGSSGQTLKDDDGGTVGERLTKSTKTAIKDSNIEDHKVEELAEQGRKQSPEVAEMEKKIKEGDVKDEAGVKPELQTAD